MYEPLIWLVTSVSPSLHATPPSDAHTEQHSPVDGGEGGLGGGEDSEEEDAHALQAASSAMYWHASSAVSTAETSAPHRASPKPSLQ